MHATTFLNHVLLKPALIFTAHAIPQVAAKSSPYPEQFRQTASAVAEILGTDFDIAYQSAPDNPTVPWTGPDINDLIQEKREADVQEVIVSPIGFLCDHVEVLYDLDLEARATAEACSMNFIRAGTVGEHPEFINMLANLVCKESQSSEINTKLIRAVGENRRGGARHVIVHRNHQS